MVCKSKETELFTITGTFSCPCLLVSSPFPRGSHVTSLFVCLFFQSFRGYPIHSKYVSTLYACFCTTAQNFLCLVYFTGHTRHNFTSLLKKNPRWFLWMKSSRWHKESKSPIDGNLDRTRFT